jgi:hypothetical protein
MQHISKREQILFRLGVLAAILIALWALEVLRPAPALVS